VNSTLQNGIDLPPKEKRALLADLLREKAARSKTVPTSFSQQRLWFLNRFEPDSPAYNIARPLRMQGALNVPVLRQTLNLILARHDVLRGRFELAGSQPVQLIAPRLEIDLPEVDLQHLTAGEREAEVSRRAIADAAMPFDLTQAPLMRVCLLKLAPEEQVLLLTMHHIISDGWSMGKFVREMAAIYQALNTGQPVELPELQIQYADFARWQREWLQGEVLEEQLGYWKQHLAGAPAVLDLPIARPRPATLTINGSHLTTILPAQLKSALNELSRREGATMFMTLLAAFKTLLYRYSGQDDLVVGSPIAGRNRVELEGLIGFFVNTLPMRTSLAGNPTFRELLRRVRETALAAYAHQDVPFEKIVEGVQPPRSLNYTPIFQVAFALQNQPRAAFSLPELKVAALRREYDTAKFDLTLFMTETEDGLGCWLEYNTDLFPKSTISHLLDHFQVLLEAIVANPDQTIAEMPLLTETEVRQTVVEWNETRVDFGKSETLPELFERQVERTPAALALIWGDQQVTYRELNGRANQLARQLRGLGVGPDIRVAVVLERSIQLVVGLLAVLKAGGAYVPVDPAYPDQRLAFMVEDAGALVLLTEASLVERLPGAQAPIICLDRDREKIAAAEEQNLVRSAGSDNLAYVIYTSGTTGRPKGVQITHEALFNLIRWHHNAFQVTAEDRATQLAGMGFDACGWELWPYLTKGASVHLADEESRMAAAQLRDWLVACAITISFVPTPVAESLLSLDWPPATALRALLTGGDRLHSYGAAGLKFKVVNNYGPTESTVVATSGALSRAEGTGELPSLGRPIANTEVYLLNSHGQPQPVGVPGEIYLGGSGLARGYLEDSELTSEKFVPHPFSREPGKRLYRTGDLARYGTDGSIHFLGRIDHQVKLRGYRIELGEIEAALREHSGIMDTVVIVRESPQGNRDLVAYVASQSDGELVAQLRARLKTKLPDYMVPAYFVVLDAFPLTPNGKIDRQALPSPQRIQADAPPRSRPANQVEQQLAVIWQEVLDREQVGVNDNFFEIGGHSLLAVRLLVEIEKVFGQKIPLVSLFQNATIASLGKLLTTTGEPGAWPTLVEIQKGDGRPPLFCVSMPNVNALGYVALARHLGADQPVYGLQAQYPEDLQGEHSQRAVDELASEYLEAIRAVAPRGPYQFVGMCRGAHIAFEMARRLRDQGQQIALVGVLDTWVLENTYKKQVLYLEDYVRRLRASLRLGLKGHLELIRNKSRRSNSPENRTGQTINATSQLANPMHAYFPGPGFKPKTYGGRVAVFRARKQPLNRIRDKELGWGKLADGGVDVHYITGEHGGSMLREPHVQVLATEIQKFLVKG